MALYFITGQAHTGKTNRLLTELDREANSRSLKRALIICPQVSAATRLGREIATKNSPLYETLSGLTLNSVETTDTNNWFRSLWAEHGAEFSLINDTDRNRILRAVTVLYQTELNSEGKNSKFLSKAGVLETLSNILSLYGTGSGNKTFNKSILEVMGKVYSNLFVRYEAEIRAQGYIERADAVRSLVDKDIQLDYVLGLNGFTSISTEYIALLRSLSVQNSVGATVLYDANIDATHGGKVLIDSLTAGCGPAGIREHLTRENEIMPVDFASSFFSKQRVTYRQFSEKGSIKLSIAEGQAAESALIISELEDKLTRFEPDEIAIIVRKTNINIWNIITKIGQRGIPYSVDLRIPLLSTAFGTALNDLLAYLKAEGFLGTGIASKPMSQPLSQSRAFRIGAFLQSPYSGWSSELFNELDAELRSKAQEIVEPVSILSSAIYQGGPNKLYNKTILLARNAMGHGRLVDWKDLLDLMLDNVMRNQLPTRLVTMQNSAAHHALFDALSECIRPAQTPKKIGMHGSVRNDSEKEMVDVEAFLTKLPELTLNLTEGQGSVGRVIITDAGRMRSRNVKALIFGGLDAESYQKDVRQTVGREINRSLRLADAKDAVLSAAEEHRLEEELFAYQVVSRASEEVSFIAQVVNEKGEHCAPSILLTEILRDELFASLSSDDIGIHSLSTFTELGISVLYATDDAARRIRFGFGEPCAPSLPEKGSYSKIGRARGLKLVPNAEIWDTHEEADDSAPQEFSPGALEKYIQCPYGWFVGRYLQSDGLDVGITPLVTGTRVHKLIQRFYEDHELRHGTMSLEGLDIHDIYDTLCALAEGKDFKLGNIGPLDFAISDEAELKRCLKLAEKRIIFDVNKRDVKTDEVQPAFFELGFGTMKAAEGDDDQDKASHKVSIGGVPIRGRIDRVDTNVNNKIGEGEGEKLVYVYDYKGSLHDFKGTKLLEMGKIQAPIYLLAAAQALDARPVGYAYLSYTSLNEAGAVNREALTDIDVPKQKKSTAWMTDQEFTQELHAVEEFVKKAAAGIVAGEIPVAMKESLTGYLVSPELKGCNYCAYRNCPVLINREQENE